MNFFYYATAGSLVIITASFIRHDRNKYPEFCVAAAFFAFSVLLKFPEVLTIRLHPHTLDAALYRMDLAIGLDPLILERFVYSHIWIYWVLVFTYVVLPLVAAIFYAVDQSRTLLWAAFVAAIAASVCYHIFPAVGPGHALIDFPWSREFRAVTDNSPRDCMPSMHFTWALLMAFNAKRLRMIAWVFVALTALATVGIGEHYFVDLIFAVPFALLIQLTVSIAYLRR